MCIACVLPKGERITLKEFENCWNSNKDGGGYAYIDNGVLVVKKSLDYNEFEKMWEKDEKIHGDYSPRLLHFRARSAGEVTIDNCHPFLPNKKTTFIHNGTLYKFPTEKEKSDTALFSEFLSKLPVDFAYNDTMMSLISEYIGSNNKVAMMTSRGHYTIFNSKNWIEDGNRVFSNSDFRTVRNRTVTTTVNQHGYVGYPQSSYASKKYSQCPWCGIGYSTDKWNMSHKICDYCYDELKSIADELGVTPTEAKAIADQMYKAHPFERNILLPPQPITKEPSIFDEISFFLTEERVRKHGAEPAVLDSSYIYGLEM